MDYEKKYNEALERAKAYHRNELAGSRKEMTEYIFPELRESEEEMTRKKAIAILKQQRDYWSYDGPIDKFPPATPRKDLVYAIDVALSYLEKQKEQKPISQADFDAAKHEALWDEQKPAWSEEDEKMIDTIVSVLGQYIDYKAVSGTGTGYATPRYSKEIAWLKSIRPSWKPSEEQMTALEECGECKRCIKELREQLKKL